MMKPTDEQSNAQILLESLARELGQGALEKAKDQAGEIIASEKLRRERANQADIQASRVRYHCCLERRKELKDTLRLAPLGDLATFQRRRSCYFVFASVLVIAGIFFAHLTLAQFSMGPEVWLFSIGLGLVAAFWTERTLEQLDSETLIHTLCIMALLCSLGGLVVMAILRGDILAMYLQSTMSGDATAQVQGVGTDFYHQAIPKLRLLMGLLAIAMELASGMAAFEARKLDITLLQAAAKARKKLEATEDEMVAIIARLTDLENEPVINEAEFWRNFHLGLLERTKRNGLHHFLVIFACVVFVGSGTAAAPLTRQATAMAKSELSVVVALDFTQSVAGKGYDGKTDFEKNVEAACQLIAQLPPATQITVLAITDRSFSQPLVLLRRELPRDRGPLQFLDRIAVARSQAVSELRRVALSSQHSTPQTDIFGALTLAADILNQSSGRKVLILFSDMRQSTGELDFERAKTIMPVQALATVTKRGVCAHLQGVEVYALGVDGVGKSFAYWNSLHGFWEAYFQTAGANLKGYSALRDSSDLDKESR